MDRFKRLMIVVPIVVVAFLVATACCPPNIFKQTEDLKKLGEELKKETDKLTKLVVPPTAPTLSAGEKDLIKNGDFADGTTGWQTRTQGGSKVEGMNDATVRAVGDFHVLEVKRTQGDNDGGGAFAWQEPNEDVSNYTSMTVRMAVDPINEEGGNIGGTQPQWFPEGPCQIRIYYKDVNGTDAEWYHGFYYSGVSGADMNKWTQVPQALWYSYTSTNLMDISPKPKLIKKVEVYGFGWNFTGYMTNVQVVVK
jgi:hypothetical protein